jgi:hypothetical protein
MGTLGAQEMTPAKPIISTFPMLAYSLRSLHHWNKTHVDNLHDIWKRGAPTPNSRIKYPKGYDPRKPQPIGNYEARIVLPTLLSKWVVEVAAEMGVNMTPALALDLLSRVRVAFTGDIQELVKKAN